MKRQALFDLIKSLTQSEKSYFKRQAAAYSLKGTNQYVQLFDVLDKMEIFDSKALKEKLNGTGLLKNLPSVKNYLYKLLLKELEHFYANQDKLAEVQSQVQQARILMDRKHLYEQSAELLEKGLKTCRTYDFYFEQLRFLQQKRALLDKMRPKNLEELALQLREEKEEVLERLQDLESFQPFYERTLILVGQLNGFGAPEWIEELDELKEKVEEKDWKVEEQGWHFKIIYYAFYDQYFRLKNQSELALSYSEKRMDVWQNSPQHIRLNEASYLGNIFQHLNLCLEVRQLDAILQGIEQLKKIGKTYPNLKQKAALLEQAFCIHYMIAKNEYEAFPKAGKKMNQLAHALPESLQTYKIYAWDILFTYYFKIEDYNECLTCISHVLKEENLMHGFYYDSAQMYSLMVHYELGNFLLLENLAKGVKRFLKKRKNFDQIGSLLANYMIRLSKSTSPQKNEHLLKSLQKELSSLKEENSYQNNAPLNFILQWISSKR